MRDCVTQILYYSLGRKLVAYHFISDQTYLSVDFRTDVEQIRQTFDTLLRQSDERDEKIEPSVQVMNVTEETMEVRALCSAKDSSTAWDLHYRLCEELMTFVRNLEDGRCLPRQRWILEGQTHSYKSSSRVGPVLPIYCNCKVIV